MEADLLMLLRSVERAGQKAWGRNCGMPCPKCQHTRKHHKKAKPLSVKRSVEGVLYHCWHCGWKGFLPSQDGARGASPQRKSQQRPATPRIPVWF